jgi:homoserine dehydrogenase
MSKLKLAVIGYGLIGNKHAKIIEKNLENLEYVLELLKIIQKLIKDFNLSCKVFSSY